jgi:hypothetical protein
MADDRSLSDVLWDYTVYAPIGLAVSLAEELPKLSEKGRDRIAGQLHTARVIGKLTVREAQRRAGRMFGDTSGASPASSPASRAGTPASVPAYGGATAGSRNGTGAGAATTSDSDPPKGGSGHRASDGTRGASEPTSSASAMAPAVSSLAIPGYDTLAASQVVQRLSSLRSDELDAIRQYEIATRGRRTILHRIAQLAADR